MNDKQISLFYKKVTVNVTIEENMPIVLNYRWYDCFLSSLKCFPCFLISLSKSNMTYWNLFSFRIKCEDFQMSFASAECLNNKWGWGANHVTLGLKTLSISSDLAGVKPWPKWGSGLQFGLRELGQVCHHTEVINLRVCHLLWLDQLQIYNQC